MRYLIILIFLSGCATNTNTANKEYEELVSELLVDMHQSDQRIEFNQISDVGHRVKAQELGIPYVDYLHMVNSNKRSVNKSYIKLRHNNE